MPVSTHDAQSLTRADLETILARWSQPAYRATQILEWIHVRRVASWDAMTNLPRSLREQLQSHYTFHPLELVRQQGTPDTTTKFLWRLHDHSLIESVLIPANPALYGQPTDRHTLCVSSQVGCAYGCKFCASGLLGWKRNLEPAEMVGQILATERALQLNGPNPPASTPSRAINNLVIMGMGEPLANYDNLLIALRILNAPWGANIGARKITISTSGLVPQIQRLAREPEQFGLAISLHGATDDVRQRIMPVNRKYPLAQLVAACESYVRIKGRMITLEYILIEGVNDSLAQIEPLAQIARRLHAKVNLIPYNLVQGLSWQRPTDDAQNDFLHALERHRVTATLRREKGHDIDAACGQLRLRTEQELSHV